MSLFHNPRVARERAYGPAEAAVLNEAGFAAAKAEITAWPDYAPTPLVALPGLARRLGLGALWFKDERPRFGLKSFKALGGAYAVGKIVRVSGGKPVTVCCATDGNHGRSVAWGARMYGAACVIYIHEHVSEGRKAAMEAFGAEVVRVPGTYDDSVRHAAKMAKQNGWVVVSDTSWPGYADIPRDVMHGYGVQADEVIAQLREVPSHALVHAGVGGWAAAIAARFWQVWGAKRPRLIVVEPDKADCVLRSAMAGTPTVAPGDLDTVMAGLSAGEISPLAWTILNTGADDFMNIPDARAIEAMRALADPIAGDKAVVAGETGAASLGGLLEICAKHREVLGDGARVLILGSEGDTDPAIYAKLVGRTAEQVLA